jgi:hypothetical protein
MASANLRRLRIPSSTGWLAVKCRAPFLRPALQDRPMRIVVAIAGFLLLATAIADAFQTVIVARHAQKLPRITRLFYQFTWILLRAGAAHSVGRTPRKLSRPVRAIIPTDFAWFLGYRPDRRFRDTSMGGGLGKVQFSFARVSLPERGHVLHARIERAAASFIKISHGDRSGAWVHLSRLRHRLSSGALSIVLEPRAADSIPGRPCWIAALTAEFLIRLGSNPEKLEERLAQWKSGRWTCCHLAIRCWPTIGHSVPTSVGSVRSLRLSMSTRWSIPLAASMAWLIHA